MQQNFFKSTGIRLIIALLVFMAAFIIHSCKKENTNQTTINITDPAVNQAKTWYQGAYPVTTATARKLTTQAANLTPNGIFDYSQHIKPDWQHAASYTRLNAKVVELPLDPSSDKISTDFKNMNTGKVIYKQQYSRSSFLLLNDGTGYKAYVMTVIADSAYIGNNLNKLNNNTYRKHDADFSGMVIYFTPKGAFVSSYGYKNGQLIPPAAPAAPAGTTTATVQSIDSKAKTRMILPYCTDWYIDTYVDGDLVSSDYLATTCDDGEGGTAGGTDGGGGGTVLPQCPTDSAGTAATRHVERI